MRDKEKIPLLNNSKRSGKGEGFRYILLPPPRTVRTTFTVYGS